MNKLLMISFCAMMFTTACNSSEEKVQAQAVVKKVEAVQPVAAVVEHKAAPITTIDWNRALEMNKAGAVLVDVRTPAEVAKGMAPSAINIALQEISQRLSEFPKDKDLLIYCRSGKRSMAASKFLTENGYTRVFNIEGGILAFPGKM